MSFVDFQIEAIEEEGNEKPLKNKMKKKSVNGLGGTASNIDKNQAESTKAKKQKKKGNKKPLTNDSTDDFDEPKSSKNKKKSRDLIGNKLDWDEVPKEVGLKLNKKIKKTNKKQHLGGLKQKKEKINNFKQKGKKLKKKNK